mmetsp:Transcript_26578/g.72977  ORF Transcript_26578/g.72977 Transcript_26578/m.72977 type:complete len:102 (-) Transcript_26578:149-454(-)
MDIAISMPIPGQMPALAITHSMAANFHLTEYSISRMVMKLITAMLRAVSSVIPHITWKGSRWVCGPSRKLFRLELCHSGWRRNEGLRGHDGLRGWPQRGPV